MCSGLNNAASSIMRVVSILGDSGKIRARMLIFGTPHASFLLKNFCACVLLPCPTITIDKI